MGDSLDLTEWVFIIFFFILIGVILFFSVTGVAYFSCQNIINQGYNAEVFFNKDGYIVVCYAKTIYNDTVRYAPGGYLDYNIENILTKKKINEVE